MALEQLTLASPVDQAPNSSSTTVAGAGVSIAGAGGSEDGGKAQRLPRWTRQEILVLIEGKRVAETRVRRGRTGMEFGSGQVEPKWATVSGYCRKRGVNRGPVQCRKRWSNLAGDFKKIKEYESQLKEENESESFWVMRNDLRRDKKLPGFFDKEVYDILDGSVGGSGNGNGNGGEGFGGGCLTLALTGAEVVEVEVEPEAVFDSGRSAGVEDGLFSDFEQSEKDGGGSPEKETQEPVPEGSIPAPTPISVGNDSFM